MSDRESLFSCVRRWVAVRWYLLVHDRRDRAEARETLDAWFDHVKDCDGC